MEQTKKFSDCDVIISEVHNDARNKNQVKIRPGLRYFRPKRLTGGFVWGRIMSRRYTTIIAVPTFLHELPDPLRRPHSRHLRPHQRRMVLSKTKTTTKEKPTKAETTQTLPDDSRATTCQGHAITHRGASQPDSPESHRQHVRSNRRLQERARSTGEIPTHGMLHQSKRTNRHETRPTPSPYSTTQH